MHRLPGMLVAIAFLFMLTGSVIVPDATANADLDDEMVIALADEGDPDGEEPKEEPKKTRRQPDRAIELQSKLKQPGPPPEKPIFKPWNKVITKDHVLHDGLIPIYTKQEEVYFVLTGDVWSSGRRVVEARHVELAVRLADEVHGLEFRHLEFLCTGGASGGRAQRCRRGVDGNRAHLTARRRSVDRQEDPAVATPDRHQLPWRGVPATGCRRYGSPAFSECAVSWAGLPRGQAR